MSQPDKASRKNWSIIFLAWFVASASTLGSLFFSYVMEFAPCVLCWYQRVFLFPLVLILAVGLLPFDKKVVKFNNDLVALLEEAVSSEEEAFAHLDKYVESETVNVPTP